ncbi:KIR protein [Plasmodium coatneyi]|uniref:KIR protein n=1 Tax=Plasmodium coatneyi TaxID=208452 RepID=A0A1B1DY88_9APIC|nr:KIR protein [Plasmodium coatneyi]ANQ07753.1 KIR protein [Plasmodium coatneyi]
MEEVPTLEETLPSYQDYYNMFEENVDAYRDQCNAQLSGLETLNGKMGEQPDKILDAACYVHREYEKGRFFTREACYFLYFWIGQTLSKTFQDDNFKNNLSEICTKMMEINIFKTHGCKDICDKVDKDLFLKRKTLFDFWYDYGAIRTLLEHNAPLDVDKCGNYLQNVEAANSPGAVNCAGGTGPSDKYCQNFWRGNGNSISLNLKKLQSKLKSVQERMDQEKEAASARAHEAETKLRKAKDEAISQAVRSATTTSSLSSIFGTLATIGAPFLLYKYKPWFSLFRNHSSGNGGGRRSNRRKKRSTGRIFDASTEDTLTEYTTDNFTIGVSRENSTLRSRAEHTRQSRGRTNNTSSHRNNVGYGRM